jgi:hypothetical protein
MSIKEGCFSATVSIVPDSVRNRKDSGWCVCAVRLEDCADERAHEEQRRCESKSAGAKAMKYGRNFKAFPGITFAGTLQSFKPYMHHRGVFHFVDKGKYGRQLQQVKNQPLEPVRPDKLFIKDCLWMLQHEVAALNSSVARTAINKAIDEGRLQPRSSPKLKQRYVLAAEFEKAFFYRELFKNCDFHRMKYQPQVMAIFGIANDKTRSDVVKALKPEALEKLHAVMSTTPWLLCFHNHCGGKYRGLKELSYFGLKRAVDAFKLHDRVGEHIWAGVRFYHGTLRAYEARWKDTLLDVERMRFYHLDKSRRKAYRETDEAKAILAEPETARDGPRLKRAVDWLLSEEVGAMVQVDAGMVILSEHYFKSRKCVKWLGEMSRRLTLPELRPGYIVPCIPHELDEEQTAVAKRILRGDPLVLIEGGPGFGKTEIIKFCMARFKSVLVTTAHGMMTKELRKKMADSNELDKEQRFREEAAHTIDAVHCRTLFTNHGREWAAQFEVLIIDEASNLDLNHMYKILRATRRTTTAQGVKQIVMVYDHNQQRPIGIGEPVMALSKRFPEAVNTLTKQHRVHPGAMAIHQTARVIISGYPEAAHYETALSGADVVALAESESARVISIDPRAGDILRPGNPILPVVLRRLISVAGGPRWPMRWQCIAFKNKDVNALSLQVFRQLREWGHINEDSLCPVPRSARKEYCPNGLLLGPGVKIIFRETFRGTYDEKTRRYDYPEVRNGEICVVEEVNEAGTLVKLTDGRIVCFERERHINPYKVNYGYAVTSYAAQGAGYRGVFTYLHKQHPYEKLWPARDSYYTALTRASRLAVVYGSRSDIDAVCSRAPRDRVTALGYLLKDLKLGSSRRQVRTDVTELRPVGSMTLAPLSYPCTVTYAHVANNKPFIWPPRVKRKPAASAFMDDEAEDDDDDDEAEDAVPSQLELELGAFAQLTEEGDSEDVEEPRKVQRQPVTLPPLTGRRAKSVVVQ